MCIEKSVSFLLILVIMILDPSAAEEPATLDGEAANPDPVPATTPRDTAEQPATVGNLGHWWHDYISKIKESTPTNNGTTKPPVQQRITKQFWWMTVEVPNDQTIESIVNQKVAFFPQNNSTCAPCPCQTQTMTAQNCPHCECHNLTTSCHDCDGPSKAPDGKETPEDNDKKDNITTTENPLKKCTCTQKPFKKCICKSTPKICKCKTTPNSIEQCTCAPGKVVIARTATLKSNSKANSRKNLSIVCLILSLLCVLMF